MYVPQRPAIHPGSPLDLFNMAKKYTSQKGKYFDDPVSLYILVYNNNNNNIFFYLFTRYFFILGKNWLWLELV